MVVGNITSGLISHVLTKTVLTKLTTILCTKARKMLRGKACDKEGPHHKALTNDAALAELAIAPLAVEFNGKY